MLGPEALGILSALTSAVIWGSGDFAGGLAARRTQPVHVLMLASLSGLLILIPAALFRREVLATPSSTVWAALAGVSGGLGIAILYRALSTGPAALVAPTAGVVGAALPMVVGSVLEGMPTGGQLVGLLLGLSGIWFVSRVADPKSVSARTPLVLAFLAGLAFGAFFVFMAQVERGPIFVPLVVAKLSAFGLAVLILLVQRRPLRPTRVNPLPFLAGVLDAGGNLFFLLALQYSRLDIAAVISSMYPAATVVLARVVLQERASRMQAVGVGLCLLAVGFIAAR
jgi:drug/metabolite transporter (DMT)-like permease